MKFFKKIIPAIFIVCILTACGSANTRYVTNSSSDTEKIEVQPVSYSVYWTDFSASITSKVNNIFFQVTKIKDKLEIAEEHKTNVPKIIDEIQNFIDESSQLNLSTEDKDKNDKRIEELRNMKLELENYQTILDDPNLTTDDMQSSVDTIKSKWEIVKAI